LKAGFEDILSGAKFCYLLFSLDWGGFYCRYNAPRTAQKNTGYKHCRYWPVAKIARKFFKN